MLLCPWDSPGKDTGGGCHFLLQEYICVRVYTHAHIYRYLSTYVPNIYLYLHLFVGYYFSPVPNLEEVDWFTHNFVGLGKEEN